jgi:hypothetical protein
MFTFGLTCPAREAIEQEGADKYLPEYMEKVLKAHEARCVRCKSDLEVLYASGKLTRG